MCYLASVVVYVGNHDIFLISVIVIL